MWDANQDFSEFIECLNSRKAEFLVIGAHAMAIYGYPRFTGDLDVWVRSTPENLERVRLAIADFGMKVEAEGKGSWLGPNEVFQMGVAPYRIDVLRSISGVEFDEAWESRVSKLFGGHEVSFLSKALLLRNKKASGRKRDLADVEELEARS
ncbi:MAG: hypothetical protein U5J83_03150 [Bryobacterales bacterium]|nr:hypothetical protein [Bryobacterales bacterium]